VAGADAEPGRGKPSSDSFVSQPGAERAGYPAGHTSAEYAATGTGTPVMVGDEFGAQPLPPVDRPGGVR